MKKNLRRVYITVTAQTAYHLTQKAGAGGPRDVGRVVDQIVREYQLTEKTKTKPKRMEDRRYVRK